MQNSRRLLIKNRMSAAALIMSGNFILVTATTLILAFTGRIEYLLILALSTGVTIFTASGIKPSIIGRKLLRNEWASPLLLTAGGTVLAAEIAALLIVFQGFLPIIYTISTIIAISALLLGSDIILEINTEKMIQPEMLTEENLVIDHLRY